MTWRIEDLFIFLDGTLQKVLHRPDWNQIALKWKDYKALPIPYNSISSESRIPIPVSLLSLLYFLPDLTISHLQCFFDQGYTKVDKIIPSNFISSALKVINYWLGQYPIPKANLLGNVELTGGDPDSLIS